MNRVVLLVCFVLVGGASAPVVAQSGPAEGENAQVGCFRGRPAPTCKSFWIFEMQGLVPMAQSSRDISYGAGTPSPTKSFEQVVEWNVGHMVNVGSSYAFGAVLTVGSGNTDVLTGIRARARRWLSPNVSVELEGGLVRKNGGRGESSSGPTADLRLNIRDQGSFFVRWDAVSLDPRGAAGTDYFDPGGTQHAISIGAAAGSWPGVFATGVTGLVYSVLLSLVIASD